jgi:hypothetical protein
LEARLFESALSGKGQMPSSCPGVAAINPGRLFQLERSLWGSADLVKAMPNESFTWLYDVTIFHFSNALRMVKIFIFVVS